MKKLSFLLMCALFSAGIAVAQKNAVDQAEKDIKSLTPNYESARKNIKGALTNPETKDNVKTWYVAGKTEYGYYDYLLGQKQIKPESVKDADMAEALYNGYTYLKKALPLDSVVVLDKKTGEPKREKDGSVKYNTKYSKDITSTVAGHLNDYSVAGSTFYDMKDYDKAYELWGVFADVAKNTKPTKEMPAVPDSIIGQITFYQGVAAYQGQKYKEAATAFENARKYDYDVKDTYDYALVCYANLNDNDGIIATATAAFPKFGGEDAQYVKILINNLINNEKYNEASELLDKAIAQAPQEAELYDVKGTISEQLGNEDEALSYFEKSIQINPSYAKGQFNVGRYYYNKAVKENDAAPSNLTVRENNEYFKNKVKPYYEQALPYMEKAYELDSSNPDIKRALSNLYYQLGDEAKLNALDAQN